MYKKLEIKSSARLMYIMYSVDYITNKNKHFNNKLYLVFATTE